MRQPVLGLAVLVAMVGVLTAAPRQAAPFFPIDEIKPGMVAVGETVFAGNTREPFNATVIGVLRNAIGPRRNLVLARLEGGPLATTGVIQGMSGSPVYIDGRLVGAVSYALGSFPKEPIAGITPIAEMIDAVDSAAPRSADASLSLTWPATPAEVFTALGTFLRRASAPLGRLPGDARILGPATLADLAPTLHPIGAALVFNGFDGAVDQDVRAALSAERSARAPGLPPATQGAALSPGDPVGMSLIHGDLDMGATGTVTYVDGTRVYAFGHPFLNLGPTEFPMTRAQVHTVLPSLDSSMKISSLGPVIGTMTQDRATAVGGTLGPGPREVEVHLSLTSSRAPARQFSFSVLRDQALTPLFSYVAMLSAMSAYERETGVMTVAVHGTVSFGDKGRVTVDDLFSGDGASAGAAAAVAAPVGAAMANEFATVMPERIDVDFHASEARESTTIDRVWLDTVRPRFGATHTLQIQLQDYRGGKRVVSLPVTMPRFADGPLTLLVTDAAGLTSLEQKDLKPAKPATWNELLTSLNEVRRNNRLYVRLISSAPGAAVGGDTLPSLPSSVRSVLAWERRLDVAVRGSRELSFSLTPAP